MLADLFNASLDGGTRRAIDIREGEAVNEAAFQALVRAAIALTASAPRKPPTRAKKPAGIRGRAKTKDINGLLEPGRPRRR